jgi:hypothetical protein
MTLVKTLKTFLRVPDTLFNASLESVFKKM